MTVAAPRVGLKQKRLRSPSEAATVMERTLMACYPLFRWADCSSSSLPPQPSRLTHLFIATFFPSSRNIVRVAIAPAK